jgi:Kef-type K+ transport system membrane component KefB
VADPELLRTLGYMLVAAALVVLAAERLKFPSIVGYILTGLVLGPLTGLLAVGEAIHVISEVGIVLLLFLVGLELSLDKIRDVGRVAVVGGLMQMVITSGVGFGLGRLLGFATMPSVFIAIALTFSSTVVVVKLLEQKKELHSLYGRIGVGMLLMQDLAVILVLTFLAGLGTPEATSLPAIASSLGLAFGGTILVVGLALGAARWVLPWAFAWIAASPAGLFIWSLCWCFLLVLVAELLHLSPEIGAFLAGVSLAQLPYSHSLRRRVHPLMSFFLAIFFVALGIQMELGAAMEQLPAALVLSAVVLLGKPLLFMWLVARSGYGRQTAFLTGITLAQISEFSFIAVAAGLSVGLIDESILSLVGLVGLVTIAVSSYLIQYSGQLLARAEATGFTRLFGAPQDPEETPEEVLRDHVIVVGMNSLGKCLVHDLAGRGERVLAIDTDARKLQDLPCSTLLGSTEYVSVLEEANLPEAKILISALQIEDANNLLAYWCRVYGVPASIHAFDRSVVDELREIGVSHLMVSKNTGVRRIAAELRSTGVLS